MKRIITSDVLVAYQQCERKAFLLYCTNNKGLPNEYVKILEQKKQCTQRDYIKGLRRIGVSVHQYNKTSFNKRTDNLSGATLCFRDKEAYCGMLNITDGYSPSAKGIYEPTVFAGTNKISREHKLEVFYLCYILSQVQGELPNSGTIVGADHKSRKIRLKDSTRTIVVLLEQIRRMGSLVPSESPPLILNKHCIYCQFISLCEARAIEEDNLSLLDRISTLKAIQKYQKKGIFTIKQLSYLYRPRKRRTLSIRSSIRHSVELQAMAIRDDKIYLHVAPDLEHTLTRMRMYLDIEGVPDRDFYYLFGLMICNEQTCIYHSFWADDCKREEHIWRRFLDTIRQHPNIPIYHYGSYEKTALRHLLKRYGTSSESLEEMLVNINGQIYGRIYFPVRSNSLKEIANYLGFSWSKQTASGLQSLVYRHHWENTHDNKYKRQLLTYNREDCDALRIVVEKLLQMKNHADDLPQVDYADQPKRYTSEIGTRIYNEFGNILKFAHANYDKTKIRIQDSHNEGDGKRKKLGAPYGHAGSYKRLPSPRKIIRVRRKRICPKHNGKSLEALDQEAEHTVIDLRFGKTGIRKTIIKYIGTKSYCPRCHRSFNPPAIIRLKYRIYGGQFRAWAVYLRFCLRLPYNAIVQIIRDQFNEKITAATILNFIKDLGSKYSVTERDLVKRMLSSPFVQADETKINIQGTQQWVWVFTDGCHVVLKFSATRESRLAREILSGYQGILISDFYPGYDSIRCRQQKCWVHLIRDLNKDLLKSPFDAEFEALITGVRDLIVPIIETVSKYGPRKRNLNKHRRQVEAFYAKTIDDVQYESELSAAYQKRFSRYRDKLFTFMEHDGIPWHNNTGERALRHLAIQRKISGTFYATNINQYLVLLSIMQTCRFKNRSFLAFLLTGDTDIDRIDRLPKM